MEARASTRRKILKAFYFSTQYLVAGKTKAAVD